MDFCLEQKQEQRPYHLKIKRKSKLWLRTGGTKFNSWSLVTIAHWLAWRYQQKLLNRFGEIYSLISGAKPNHRQEEMKNGRFIIRGL